MEEVTDSHWPPNEARWGTQVYPPQKPIRYEKYKNPELRYMLTYSVDFGVQGYTESEYFRTKRGAMARVKSLEKEFSGLEGSVQFAAYLKDQGRS